MAWMNNLKTAIALLGSHSKSLTQLMNMVYELQRNVQDLEMRLELVEMVTQTEEKENRPMAYSPNGGEA